MSSSLSPDMHTPLQSSTPAAATTPPVVPGGSTGSGLLSPTTPGPVAGGTHSAGGSRATYAPQSLTALEAYKKKDASKVVVRFKAIGNAPIMKNNYFRITAFNRFQAVIQFLRKELGWKAGDALYLYINSSFSPAPDDTVGNLFRCFGTEGHLIVNYSTQAAWG